MLVKCKSNGKVYSVLQGRVFDLDAGPKVIQIPDSTIMAKRLKRFAKGDSTLNHRFEVHKSEELIANE